MSALDGVELKADQDEVTLKKGQRLSLVRRIKEEPLGIQIESGSELMMVEKIPFEKEGQKFLRVSFEAMRPGVTSLILRGAIEGVSWARVTVTENPALDM